MKKVVILCAVVVAFGALSGCITSKQSYVAKGNKLYDAGKYEDATLNYRKAMQKDPNYGEAYYRLGLAAIKQNQARVAYDSLLRAVQLLPGRLEVTEKFADVCLSFYLADSTRPKFLYTELTKLADQLLDKNPSSYEGLILRGYLAETDRKDKLALGYFNKAIQVNGSDAGVATERVILLIRDGEIPEAERLAKDMMDRQKIADGRIYDVMFDYYRKDRPADAENVLKAKIANNPKQAEYAMQLARYYSERQNPAQMKAVLQRLLDNPKDFPDARLWVGDFYMGQRDYPEAIRFYEEGARSSPDANRKSVYQNKALLALLAQGKRNEAFRLTEQILQANPNDDNALRLRADLMLDTGNRENIDAALKVFQKLQTAHPSDPVLRFHLGRAYQRKGDLDAARAQFVEALRLRRDFLQAKYALTEVSLDQHRAGEAMQQANEILATHPDDQPARLLHARALIEANNGTAARKELEQLMRDFPKNNEPALQMASLAINEQKFPEAIVILERLRNAGESRAFGPLVTAYMSQRKFDKATEVLRAGLKISPDSPLLMRQLGSLEALEGHYDMALAQFQKLVAINPKSIQDRVELAEVYDLKQQPEDALKAYRQAYELDPTNAVLATTVADALAKAGRNKEAAGLYQGVLKAHPDNMRALNNLAFLLADTGGNLDEALRMAQHALAKNPEEATVSDTIGYIYLKKGLHESAIQIFGNLSKKHPKYASFRFHLGLALYQKGDKTGARKELQAALADHPSTQDERKIKELLSKLS